MSRGGAGRAGEGQLSLELDLLTRGLSLPGQSGGPLGGTPRGARVSAADIARALKRPAPTDEQVAVIEAPVEPLLVVAGAGSGKTETMAARVVWLVANGLVEPDQVLGLTFTRKAAGELADRVRARLRALHRRGLTGEPRPVTVATYHSYAAGVLGDHALRLGVEPGARLLGEAGGWQLVDELVQRWDGDMSGVESARGTVVEAVLGMAGECAEHLLEPEGTEHVLRDVLERVAALPAQAGDGVPGRPKPEVREVVARLQARSRLIPLVAAYRRRKREIEVLDFGDQVALAATLARETPEVGAGERARYRVVLLDEYQDTSHAQLVLLRSLFGDGHPVTAVGDPHQSIYGWRGASAGNLQRFPHDFPLASGEPAPVGHLSASWRNDRAVLHVANRLAASLRVPAPWADARRHVEVLALRARPDAGPGLVRAEWHRTLEDEARAVADLAERAWRGGPEDERPAVAVLCRTRSQFPLLEAALRGRGLPVEVVGLGGLLHVPEIADLRAALDVVYDPTRGDSLMRLLTGAAWRLGPRDLDALGSWSSVLLRRAVPPEADTGSSGGSDAIDERSIVEALDDLPPEGWTGPEGQSLSDAGRRRLGRLAALLRGLRSRTGLALPDLVLEVERALLLDVEVAAAPGRSQAAARAHLDAFVDVAASFAEAGDQPTLGGFLGWLTAAEAQERGLDAGVVEQREDAVQLLTVHGAKGLEWDVVAVTGLVEGTFPAGQNGRAPARSKGWLGELGAVPFPLRGDADGLPQWDWQAAATQEELAAGLERFSEQCGAHEVAEERRLAYVAVTRARRELLLTGALWGDGKLPRSASRFLREVAELAHEQAELPHPAGGTPAIDVGTWVEMPEDGVPNPRDVLGRRAAWPVDPLGERRAGVEEGARLVREVRHQLPGRPPAGTPHRAYPDDEAGAWAREVDVLLAERDVARSARLEVELPAHLSASRVVALAGDPAALALRLRRPMPEPPSPQARRGSAFHAWLERRFGAAALVDVDELPGAGDDAAADDDLAELQATFLASEWAERTAEAVEVAVETPVAEVMLRGRIDAVFRRDDGGWDVVDWKTGSPPGPAEAVARSVQLAIYRLAWARLHDVPVDRVSAAFFYARTGETVRPVDLLDEADLEALLAVE